MGAVWLTDLADWLSDAGLAVVEYDGWPNRARSSGGFDADRPWCVMWHHTASNTSPENDADYICHGSDIAPISNLLVDRDGVVWILAAGATNTNGSGGPWVLSRGIVPADCMNVHAVGMEIANTGVGETYPAAQIEAAFLASVTIGHRLELEASDVCSHAAWAPGRKIDPAGPTAGDWHPAPVNASGTWSLDDLVAEHVRRWDLDTGWTDEGDAMLFRTDSTGDALYVQGEDLAVRHVSAYEGAIAEAGAGGWADGAVTLTGLAPDVVRWLEAL